MVDLSCFRFYISNVMSSHSKEGVGLGIYPDPKTRPEKSRPDPFTLLGLVVKDLRVLNPTRT